MPRRNRNSETGQYRPASGNGGMLARLEEELHRRSGTYREERREKRDHSEKKNGQAWPI